jgi:hypothetical protein
MISQIAQETDFNYFNRVSVSHILFIEDPDVIFPFRGNPSFLLINEGVDIVEYSFNGTTVHGDLVPNTSTSALIFNNCGISKIWFRVIGSTTDIRVEAIANGTIS